MANLLVFLKEKGKEKRKTQNWLAPLLTLQLFQLFVMYFSSFLIPHIHCHTVEETLAFFLVNTQISHLLDKKLHLVATNFSSIFPPDIGWSPIVAVSLAPPKYSKESQPRATSRNIK